MYEDMSALCKMFCRSELKTEMERLQQTGDTSPHSTFVAANFDMEAFDSHEEREEEEKEEI